VGPLRVVDINIVILNLRRYQNRHNSVQWGTTPKNQ